MAVPGPQDQYDDILLNVLPPSIQDTLHKNYYAQETKKSVETFGITTFVSDNPTEYLLDYRIDYQKALLDPRFLDYYFAKRMFNPVNSLYLFSDTVLKRVETDPTDDFLVLVPPSATSLQKYNYALPANAGPVKKKVNFYKALLNPALKSTYIYLDDSTEAVNARNIQDILFRCKRDSGGGGYTLDQYIKDLTGLIKNYEELITSKIEDCVTLISWFHDDFYLDANKSLLAAINKNLKKIGEKKEEVEEKMKKLDEIDKNIAYLQNQHDQLIEHKEEAYIIVQSQNYIDEAEQYRDDVAARMESFLQEFRTLKSQTTSQGLDLENQVKSVLDLLLEKSYNSVVELHKDLPSLESMFHAPKKMIINVDQDLIITGCDTSFMAVRFEDFLKMVQPNLAASKIAKCRL